MRHENRRLARAICPKVVTGLRANIKGQRDMLRAKCFSWVLQVVELCNANFRVATPECLHARLFDPKLEGTNNEHDKS
jgi:hypothetical protein